MARNTKEAAQETRNGILDTAELVFSAKGVSRTSLSDIAEAAGVTRGAIYWHFKNKVDLFEAMMERVTLPMEEIVSAAGASALEDPVGYIRQCAVNVLVSTAKDQRLQRVFEICCHKCEYVDDMMPLRERHVASRNVCIAQVEQGIRNAIANGSLPRTVDARCAAIGMHAFIDGLIANWVLEPGYFSLGAEAGRLVDTYLAGLRGPAPLATPTRGARNAAARKAGAKPKAPALTAARVAPRGRKRPPTRG